MKMMKSALIVVFMGYSLYTGEALANCVLGTVQQLTESSSRTLSSLNYPSDYIPNHVCTWQITVPTDSIFTFNIGDMDIENSTSCTKDFLLLAAYDDKDTPWYQLCGVSSGLYTAPEPTSIVYVRFRADYTVHARGFNLTWDFIPDTTRSTENDCVLDTDQQLTESSSRTLNSPNYPWQYIPNYVCTWKITVPTDSIFTFNIGDMDIQDSASCTKDFLLLAAFDDKDTPWYQLCGVSSGLYTAPESTSIAYVRFRADYTVVASGFTLTWDFIPDPTSSTEAVQGSNTNSGDSTVTIAVAVSCSIVGVILFILLCWCLCCKKNAPCKGESDPERSTQRTSSNAWVNGGGTVQPSQTLPDHSYKKFNANVLAPPSHEPEIKKKRKKIIKRTREQDKEDDDLNKGGPHIMISYQWDVKPQVLQFRALLDKKGFRVWIDVEMMHKNASTFESMAEAVDNAVVVIPVLTDKYQQSVNCRKEIEYADKCAKHLVPIRMQNDFEVSNWLQFLLGKRQQFDLENKDTGDTGDTGSTQDAEVEKLLDYLETCAKDAKKIPKGTDDVKAC